MSRRMYDITFSGEARRGHARNSVSHTNAHTGPHTATHALNPDATQSHAAALIDNGAAIPSAAHAATEAVVAEPANAVVATFHQAITSESSSAHTHTHSPTHTHSHTEDVAGPAEDSETVPAETQVDEDSSSPAGRPERKINDDGEELEFDSEFEEWRPVRGPGKRRGGDGGAAMGGVTQAGDEGAPTGAVTQAGAYGDTSMGVKHTGDGDTGMPATGTVHTQTDTQQVETPSTPARAAPPAAVGNTMGAEVSTPSTQARAQAHAGTDVGVQTDVKTHIIIDYTLAGSLRGRSPRSGRSAATSPTRLSMTPSMAESVSSSLRESRFNDSVLSTGGDLTAPPPARPLSVRFSLADLDADHVKPEPRLAAAPVAATRDAVDHAAAEHVAYSLGTGEGERGAADVSRDRHGTTADASVGANLDASWDANPHATAGQSALSPDTRDHYHHADAPSTNARAHHCSTGNGPHDHDRSAEPGSEHDGSTPPRRTKHRSSSASKAHHRHSRRASKGSPARQSQLPSDSDASTLSANDDKVTRTTHAGADEVESTQPQPVVVPLVSLRPKASWSCFPGRAGTHPPAHDVAEVQSVGHQEHLEPTVEQNHQAFAGLEPHQITSPTEGPAELDLRPSGPNDSDRQTELQSKLATVAPSPSSLVPKPSSPQNGWRRWFSASPSRKTTLHSEQHADSAKAMPESESHAEPTQANLESESHAEVAQAKSENEPHAELAQAKPESETHAEPAHARPESETRAEAAHAKPEPATGDVMQAAPHADIAHTNSSARDAEANTCGATQTVASEPAQAMPVEVGHSWESTSVGGSTNGPHDQTPSVGRTGVHPSPDDVAPAQTTLSPPDHGQHMPAMPAASEHSNEGPFATSAHLADKALARPHDEPAVSSPGATPSQPGIQKASASKWPRWLMFRADATPQQMAPGAASRPHAPAMAVPRTLADAATSTDDLDPLPAGAPAPLAAPAEQAPQGQPAPVSTPATWPTAEAPLPPVQPLERVAEPPRAELRAHGAYPVATPPAVASVNAPPHPSSPLATGASQPSSTTARQPRSANSVAKGRRDYHIPAAVDSTQVPSRIALPYKTEPAVQSPERMLSSAGTAHNDLLDEQVPLHWRRTLCGRSTAEVALEHLSARRSARSKLAALKAAADANQARCADLSLRECALQEQLQILQRLPTHAEFKPASAITSTGWQASVIPLVCAYIEVSVSLMQAQRPAAQLLSTLVASAEATLLEAQTGEGTVSSLMGNAERLLDAALAEHTDPATDACKAGARGRSAALQCIHAVSTGSDAPIEALFAAQACAAAFEPLVSALAGPPPALQTAMLALRDSQTKLHSASSHPISLRLLSVWLAEILEAASAASASARAWCAAASAAAVKEVLPHLLTVSALALSPPSYMQAWAPLTQVHMPSTGAVSPELLGTVPSDALAKTQLELSQVRRQLATCLLAAQREAGSWRKLVGEVVTEDQCVAEYVATLLHNKHQASRWLLALSPPAAAPSQPAETTSRDVVAVRPTLPHQRWSHVLDVVRGAQILRQSTSPTHFQSAAGGPKAVAPASLSSVAAVVHALMVPPTTIAPARFATKLAWLKAEQQSQAHFEAVDALSAALYLPAPSPSAEKKSYVQRVTRLMCGCSACQLSVSASMKFQQMQAHHVGVLQIGASAVGAASPASSYWHEGAVGHEPASLPSPARKQPARGRPTHVQSLEAARAEFLRQLQGRKLLFGNDMLLVDASIIPLGARAAGIAANASATFFAALQSALHTDSVLRVLSSIQFTLSEPSPDARKVLGLVLLVLNAHNPASRRLRTIHGDKNDASSWADVASQFTSDTIDKLLTFNVVQFSGLSMQAGQALARIATGHVFAESPDAAELKRIPVYVRPLEIPLLALRELAAARGTGSVPVHAEVGSPTRSAVDASAAAAAACDAVLGDAADIQLTELACLSPAYALLLQWLHGVSRFQLCMQEFVDALHKVSPPDLFAPGVPAVASSAKQLASPTTAPVSPAPFTARPEIDTGVA